MKTKIVFAGLLFPALADDPYTVDKIIPIAIVSSVCIVLGGIFILWFVNCIRTRLRRNQHLTQIKAKSKRRVAS